MTASPAPSPLTPARPARRRTRARGAGAALVAGSLLTGVLGLSAPVTTSAATLVDWSDGARPWGGRGDAYGGPGSTTQTSTADSEPATAAESQGVALVSTVLPGGEAAGTGVVLTADGEVLTNYHVVEGSTSVRVTLPGSGSGRTYPASVVGADRSADVALLQLEDASGLTAAKIDDDTLEVGDDVTAVGNAGGTGVLSAADGEVTDLSASITTSSEGSVDGENLTGLIETSADVVPGDSGGPLLDDEGEVVGIDTAASSGREIDGYAVPIATALAVVTQIRSGEETADVRIGPAAFLGVQVATSAVSDSAYGRGYADGSGSSSGASTGAGAAVAGVVDGDAAQEAGIAAGDTITKVGSTTVTDASDLTTALESMDPGDQVRVTWTTGDGRQRSATLTLDASPVN